MNKIQYDKYGPASHNSRPVYEYRYTNMLLCVRGREDIANDENVKM